MSSDIPGSALTQVAEGCSLLGAHLRCLSASSQLKAYIWAAEHLPARLHPQGATETEARCWRPHVHRNNTL